MIFFAAILKIPLKNFGNESDIHVFILLSLESSGVFNMSCDTSVFVLRYHLQFLFFFFKKATKHQLLGNLLVSESARHETIKNIFNLLSQ